MFAPNIVSGILVTMWRHFFYRLVFRPKLRLTPEGQNRNFQYVCVRIFPQILDIFLVYSIQFFFSHFKNINFFEIGPKLTFLQCFFCGTIFSAEEFLLSEKMVTKMWRYCEKNSAHIVTQNIRWHRNYSHNTFTFCLPFSKKEGILPQRK